MARTEGLTRRAVLGGTGALLALAANSDAIAADEPRAAAIAEASRPASAEAMKELWRRKYRIRIANDYRWTARFVLCDMREGVHHRVDVPGRGNYESRQEMFGGDRVAIVWDEFLGRILAYDRVMLNANVEFTIDANGNLTWRYA